MNKKLWGGRFTAETDPQVELFNASIQFDSELAYEDILGSLAHAEMLQQCGLFSPAEHQQVQKGLHNIAQQLMRDEIVFRTEDEDIHMNIERLLHEQVGDAAKKLHTARSRNDQVALDVHLYLRKQVVIIVDLLSRLQTTLLSMAQQHRHVILPGYTHLQRAQPIYLAQHWCAYISMLQRDIERLQDGWKRINHSPLGAGALAGSSFNTDKEFVAKELGFSQRYLNTLDAVSDRDFVVEFLAASALIMMHLSRFSEELILWSSQEFNFISFDDAFATGSSIMPQKKNPDVAELSRGKTGRVYGALMSLLTVLKGLPLAYNKDMQEDKEPLFDTVKTLRSVLSVYAPMLATLKINQDIMLAATADGFLNATALAEYLVKKGCAFRTAHEVSGKMVNHCIREKCKLDDLSLAAMQKFSPLIQDDIFQALAIENVAANQDKGNKDHISLIDKEISQRQQQLTATTAWLKEKHDLLHKVSARFGLTVG